MDLQGKSVMLTGTFPDHTRAEVTGRLTELGARVTASVSARTDLVFAGDRAGGKVDTVMALGVPVYDAAALARVLSGETEPAPEPVAFPVPGADTTATEAEELLRAADWTSFDSATELPGLRAALSDLERREGVTGAHRLATEKLRERGALLRHPDGHQTGLSSHALSPDGRYLAVGSWIGDDYDRGGMIQIWEVATGRCVNVLDGIHGGQGWPDRHRTIQWSADGRVLAAEFNTNWIGRWDPFGDQVHPPLATVSAGAVSGASRPVGFALHPDGTRVFVQHGESDTRPGSGVDGCLAALRQSYWRGSHGSEPDPVAMVKPRAKLFASMHGATMNPAVSWFSADGSRIWGYGEWLWPEDGDDFDDIDWEKLKGKEFGAFAIDVKTRRLSWFVDSGADARDDGDRMAVSPDETLVVVDHGAKLTFLDAATGRRLEAVDKPHGEPRLVWGAGSRLAVVGAKRGGVRIFEGTRYRCDLPVTPKDFHGGLPDCCAWAWSPDGARAACLTADGTVELWSLSGEPHRVAVLDAPPEAYGLWWGEGDVLVVGGPHCLAFHELASGRVLGDMRIGHEVDQPRPLWHITEDLGQRFRPNPTFAVDDDTWAVAFAEGAVIADADAPLDARLAWSVDRRFAWPYRWGEAPVAEGVAGVYPRLGDASQELVKGLRSAERRDAHDAWPPPATDDVEGLYTALDGALRPFDRQPQWHNAVARARRFAARQRARAGRIKAAVRLARNAPSVGGYALAMAEVALILAATGEPTARDLHRDAVDMAAIEMEGHQVPSTASAIGAGYLALGEPDRGEEWIQRAVEGLGEDPNPWEQRLAVCWALLEAGAEDRARKLWTVDEPGSPVDRAGWLAHLLRIGREDLMREFLYERHGSWYDYGEAHSVFVALGRADLLREYCERTGRSIDEEELAAFAEAERNAEPNRPTEADVADLRSAYAELLRTPIGRRRAGVEGLVCRAAACGHHSAALDLLSLLPAEDFDGRAHTAERALWIALTGFDAAPR